MGKKPFHKLAITSAILAIVGLISVIFFRLNHDADFFHNKWQVVSLIQLSLALFGVFTLIMSVISMVKTLKYNNGKESALGYAGLALFGIAAGFYILYVDFIIAMSW